MQVSPDDPMEQTDSGRRAPAPVVLITLGAAICAGVAGMMASGALAFAGIVAIALGAAFLASRAATPSGSPSELARGRRLLLLVDRGGTPEPKTPPDFTEEWAELYEKVNRLVFDAKTTPAAVSQLEQLLTQIEMASGFVRDGKDPLVESPALRASPLLPLLDSMKSSASAPLVSTMRLGEEEELIGTGQDALPPDWPMPRQEGLSTAEAVAIQNGLQALIREIESLRGTLAGGVNGDASPSGDDAALRTPAQLVDAVVLTAADGIEDLAAGLMRANELASVAERVTNRATLLALNAALEATRSGSEAFAAIAEETRRLAEYAREATDTIARLSSEIEYKVGETITAIHATSEDAKSSLAQMGGAPVPVNNTARAARIQVVRLLERSRELLQTLGSSEPASVPAREAVSLPDAPKSMQDHVENAPQPADKSPVEGVLLIEGLKPGADPES